MSRFSDFVASVRSGFGRNFWIANTLELFERFAYYSSKSILAIYVAETVGLGPVRATFVVAISVGGAGYAIMKEAIPILRWINDHAEFIRQVLVDHPSMLSVLEWLLSRLPPL